MSNLSQIKRQIEELEAYKASIERRQLKFPLDKLSGDILHKDILISTGRTFGIFDFVVNVAAEVKLNDKFYLVSLSLQQ